ncbi:hypothetical protein GQ457_01G047440 [Hibiscus cannabinus]
MDAIISSAVEEICSKGRDGVALHSLCSKLASSVEIKRALWANLLQIPTVQFLKRNRVYDRNDLSILRFDDAEKLDLIVVAKDKLCDNFLGIYDFSLGGEEKEFHQQRLVLERIASARTTGITQSQLSKEFGIAGNRFFYLVKKLEKRGLIIRQEALERTKGSGKQGQTTKLIHLYRYAKQLRSQEKFEVTKDEGTEGKEDSNVGHMEEDVLVNDNVPLMKAICDKLEEAHGKVLVMSDVKHDLGYLGSRQAKHRWAKIYGRLKNAGVVEETTVKVNGKDKRCLHLLKKFSCSDFEKNTVRCVEGKEWKLGRCQITNQLVELPIDHQIYDTIDATGSKGMLITEVGKRFGIERKPNHKNCFAMSNKFGMPMQMELHNKSHEYRIRTARNSESSNVIQSKSKDLFSKNSSLGVVNPRCSGGSALISDLWNSETDTLWKTNNYENEMNLSSCSQRDSEASNSISHMCKPQELIHETRTAFPNRTVHSVKSATLMLKPCQSLTVDSTRREQRILELLQVEKIVLRTELYRFLVNLEKDKGTTMDRKTVDKILYKLANEGQCKYIDLDIHEIMDTSVNRKVKVVLHPSIPSLSSEVIGVIRARVKSFSKLAHGKASFRKKNNNSVRLLDCVQISQTYDSSNSLSLRTEAMRANGFIFSKMVRARLLHSFLWDYAHGLSARGDVLTYGRQDNDLQNPCVTHNLFDMEGATKGIPLELFLQVVGSTVVVDNMKEKFKKGVCLCDLSIQEYNDLNCTSAIRRLSSIVSILQRLKLIRLVTRGSSGAGVILSHSGHVYALELKPYIEEPLLVATHSNSGFLDLFPEQEIVRHEFILSNRDDIDEYWQFLEYTYAGVDPKAASHAFPGSTVHEIFGYRSWTSLRRMTVGQHAMLLKLLAKCKFNEKLPYKKCKEIAKNLNLTMEQVLCVYYAKLRRRKRNQNLNAQEMESQPVFVSSFSQKRKRSAKARVLKRRKVGNETGLFSQQNLPGSAGNDKDFAGEENKMLASPQERESQLQGQEEDQWKGSERSGVNGDKYHSSTDHSAFSKLNLVRTKRFQWTDDADRQLIIQYVKNTVGLGANLTEEGRLSYGNLPVHPSACYSRMRLLKKNSRFKESLRSLCNMFSKQHEKQLEHMEKRSMDDGNCGPLVPSSSGAGIKRSLFEGIECNKSIGFLESDSFSEEKINIALEEVLRSRQEHLLRAPSNANVCDYRFPLHTGSNAARFSRWLLEHEKDFMRGGLDLTADLKCGETFHLFALVTSGELFIFPSIPVEGVGEAEFIRGLYAPVIDDSTIDYRREKGFPDIKLSVHRAPVPRDVSLESSFKNRENFGDEHFIDGNYLGSNSGTFEVGSTSSHSEIVKENLNFQHTVPTPGDSCKSPWELMVGHAAHLMPLPSSREHVGSLSVEVFKSVYTAIQKAGDQGLTIGEVSRVVNTLGEKMAELIIDVLQKFGQAEKVIFDGSLRFIARSTMQGNSKKKVLKRIISRAFRIVMQNPGILEVDIIRKMDMPMLNSQPLKKLLRFMVRCKHLMVKKKHQTKRTGVPAILGTLIGGNLTKCELIYREHFFANPKSTFLL